MNDDVYFDDLFNFISNCPEPLKHGLCLYLGQLMYYHGYKTLYDNIIRKVDINE